MLYQKKRRSIVVLLVSLVSLSVFSQTSPNVVVILADDFGFGDIAEYRRLYMPQGTSIPVQTPVLDQLMAEGMHFTDAHSPTALCAPTRYSVMTGNNPYHSAKPLGVFDSFGLNNITDSDLTLGELMKNGGYETAFIGKWHQGADWEAINSSNIYRGQQTHNTNTLEVLVDLNTIVGRGPNFEGFDYSFNLPAGVQDVPYMIYENNDWYKIEPASTIAFFSDEDAAALNFEIDKKEGYGDSNWDPHLVGPLIANKAVDFINSVDTNTNPLFLYYNSQAVHIPHTPADELDGVSINGVHASKHLDMIKELDVQLGMIINALKAKGVYDNTVFIFTSDNGGLGSFNGTANYDATGIYKGNKNSIDEGGHRVPFIVRWPNNVAAGSTYNGLASGVDILATLAAITNQTLPESQGKDSFNLLPILLGEANPQEREFMMLQSGSGSEGAIRVGDIKLTFDFANSNFVWNDITVLGLYDLGDDPTESSNLINDTAYVDIIRYMLELYEDVRYNQSPTKLINVADTVVLPGLVNASSIPLGETVLLRPCANSNKIFSIDTQGDSNIANDQLVLIDDTGNITDAEKFFVNSHSKAGVFIQSVLTGNYLRVQNDSETTPINAGTTNKDGDWTRIGWDSTTDNNFTLKSLHFELNSSIGLDRWFRLDTSDNKVYPDSPNNSDASVCFQYEVFQQLSVEDISQSSLDIKVYPVPMADAREVIVEVPNNFSSKPYTFDVFDLTGKLLFSKTLKAHQLNNSKFNLNLSAIKNSSVLFLKITNEQRTSIKKLF